MIRTEPPHLGLRHNWDVASKRIQCWADAVGAMVYHIGRFAVLALDQDEAARIVAVEGYDKELKRIRSEIRSLENKIADLENEILDWEQDEQKMLAAIKEAKQLVSPREPESIQNHPTLAFYV